MEKLTRRKLLKGSAKAAPLLALATSKSVWASGGNCPSAATSNNFSGVEYECRGESSASAVFFKNNVHCWPSGIFAGLFLFRNKQFSIDWDWTMGTHGYSTNATQLFGWSKNAHVASESSDRVTRASTWRGLLRGHTPGFINSSTVWESLSGGREGRAGEEEYHFATAILNASHKSISYGYNAAQLVEYCKRAEEANSKSALNKFIDSLVRLNARGGVETDDLQVYSESDLVECYSMKNTKRSRFSSVSKVSMSETSKSDASSGLNTELILGDASSYPAI